MNIKISSEFVLLCNLSDPKKKRKSVASRLRSFCAFLGSKKSILEFGI